MPAAAHVLKKKNRSRQPLVPFRKPNVARECKVPGTFYRPRDHEASLFFKVVRDHFDDSEHRTCREHPDAIGTRRAAPWTGAVNLNGYILKSFKRSMDIGGR